MYLTEAGGQSFIEKSTPTQVFSCEFCKISKNRLFYRIPLVVASIPQPNSALCCISYRNQLFDLHCKLNDWFLYKMQNWAEFG